MSFVLTFFRAPGVSTVQQAADFKYKQPSPAPEPTGHFAAFVERISEYFPDLSNVEDAQDRNLWPEGLSGDAGHGPVVNVLVNGDMLDPGVMAVIAREASLSGLQILDEQNGLLYGLGSCFVGMDGGMPQRLPKVTPHARSVMTENIRGLRLLDGQRLIADGLAEALGAGFWVVAGDHETVVRREHGDLHQIIGIRVMRSVEQPGRARVYVRLGFASEMLVAVWLPLLPASFRLRKERSDRAAGGVATQVCWFLPSLIEGDPTQSVGLSSRSDMGFADAAQLGQLVTAARSWSVSRLLPFLEGIRTEADLRRLFIHDAGLKHFRQGQLSFPIYPTMLTLARQASQETLAAYAAACRANPDLKELCNLYNDPAGSHIEALVKGLQALSRDG